MTTVLVLLTACVTVTTATSPLQLRRFGVNVHKDQSLSTSAMLDLCQAAQVTRQDGWWRFIEPTTRGVYDWTFTDSWMGAINRTKGTTCASGKTNLVNHFLLMGGNHLYTGKDQTSPTTPDAVAGYTRFVVAMMTRYVGLDILWEIYNEADLDARGWTVNQYATLLKSVGKAVRANSVIANEVIVGPSTSNVDCTYVQTLKTLGALQNVDAVSVHSYSAGGPEQMRGQYHAMREIIGYNTALLSGEWGWATCSVNGKPSNCVGGTMPDVVSKNDQAMYVARQWLVNALERIPLSIYYDYTDDCSSKSCTTAYDRTQAEMNYGLRMSNSGAAKPAFNAAVAVQKFVGRRPFLAQLGNFQSTNNMEYVLSFGAEGDGPPAVSSSGGNAEVFAVWTLSADGSTTRVTGSKDNAYCAGDALFTGMSSDCNGLCQKTAGCRGYVTYSTGSVHANSNCQLTASRCTIPRPVSGCGINKRKANCGGNTTKTVTDQTVTDPACDSAVAHTLTPSPHPPSVVFTLPSGTRSTCYSVFDVVGAALPDLCAVNGRMTVKATESPVYLVGK